MTRDEATDVLARMTGMWRRELDPPAVSQWMGVLVPRDYADALAAIVYLIENEEFFPSAAKFIGRYQLVQSERVEREQREDRERNADRIDRERDEALRTQRAIAAVWIPIARRLTDPFTADSDPVRKVWLEAFPGDVMVLRRRSGETGVDAQGLRSLSTLIPKLQEAMSRPHRKRRSPRGIDAVAGFSTLQPKRSR